LIVLVYTIGLIRGDGIGPEIIGATVSVLQGAFPGVFDFFEVEAGLEYYRRTGRRAEEGWIDRLREADAVLKGPLETPKEGGFESLNLELRRELGLRGSIRPFKSIEGISPVEGLDLVVVRELLEDVYSGVEAEFPGGAFALKIVTVEGTREAARLAGEIALMRSKRVTVLHKSTVVRRTDGLWLRESRRVLEDMGVEADDVLVDTAAYLLVKEPHRFDVILAQSAAGDIISDLAAGLVGSLGLAGSAMVGPRFMVFEPVHGSAPDIAGKGIANPASAMLSAALMMQYLGHRKGDERLKLGGKALEAAVHTALKAGCRTPDLGGKCNTLQFAHLVYELLTGSRKKSGRRTR